MEALSQRRSQDVSCWLQVRCPKQTPVQPIRTDTARGRMRAFIRSLRSKKCVLHPTGSEGASADRAGGASLDHLVGAGEKRLRYGEAQRLSGFEIDDQVELGWLVDRQITGFGSRQYSADVGSGLAVGVGQT
jgi:hypothetical protein